MTRKVVVHKNRMYAKSLIVKVGGLGLLLCLSALTISAQESQPSDIHPTVQEQQNDSGQAPDQQRGAPQQSASPQQNSPAQGAASQTAPPQNLTLPAGTVIRVRTNEWLSSDHNFPGDAFSAVLDQSIVVDGWVVGRRGQSETGRVSVARKAERGGGNSQLGLQLSGLTLVDGQQLPLETQMVQNSTGGPSTGQKAAVVGTTTGIGAAVGAVADGGPGAAIGAGVGAVAGLIGVQSTRGRPTLIPPETVLSFRLQTAVTISTERSQLAFQPVTQDDYDSHPANGRPQRFEHPGGPRPGYPPPPPYYGYPYAYGYYPYGYYPAPFAFGFYGGFGPKIWALSRLALDFVRDRK